MQAVTADINSRTYDFISVQLYYEVGSEREPSRTHLTMVRTMLGREDTRREYTFRSRERSAFEKSAQVAARRSVIDFSWLCFDAKQTITQLVISRERQW
jgi:hypothetical protein